MRRFVWFASGAACAVAILVAAPELYERLREAVAGGPVAGEDDGEEWADDAGVSAPVAVEDTSEIPVTPPPPPPPADGEADALRSRIGEGRERLRQKAEAATPPQAETEPAAGGAAGQAGGADPE